MRRKTVEIVTQTIARLALEKSIVALSIANGTSPALKQTPWFIDPQNRSGKASPDNTGHTALDPLPRFSSLFERWGTVAPLIVGTTTVITLMSTGILDGSDPVDLRPQVADGGGFLLDGTLKVVVTGTFSAVTIQNRTTAQRYQATVSGALPGDWWTPFVNMLVHDTTTDAWFWVMEDIGAKTAVLTRPKSTSTAFITSPLLTVGAGDSFVIYDVPAIDLVRFSPASENFANSSFTQFYPCQIQHIAAETSTAFAQPGTTHISGDAVVVESRLISREPSLYSGSLALANCFSGGPQMFTGAGICIALSGVISATDEWTVLQGGTILLDGDVYVDDHLHPSNCQVIVGLAFFHHRDDAGGAFVVPSGQDGDAGPGAGVSLLLRSYFYGSCALWGPTELVIAPGADVVYQGSAVNCFLNTGGMTLDGITTASSYDGAGTWHGGINVTPANLDAAAGAAGFGGCAYGRRGTKIHRWD